MALKEQLTKHYRATAQSSNEICQAVATAINDELTDPENIEEGHVIVVDGAKIVFVAVIDRANWNSPLTGDDICAIRNGVTVSAFDDTIVLHA